MWGTPAECHASTSRLTLRRRMSGLEGRGVDQSSYLALGEEWVGVRVVDQSSYLALWEGECISQEFCIKGSAPQRCARIVAL